MDNQRGDLINYDILPGLQIKSLRSGIGFIVYTGRSMSPTIQESELLEFSPYNKRHVSRGDVIYFSNPVDKVAVVHRVVKITSRGFETKGDNNPRVDDWNLAREQIIGRVIAACRGSKRRMIAGGWWGYFLGTLFHGIYVWGKNMPCFFSHVYHWLYEIGFILRLLPKRLRPRIIRFYSIDGVKLSLFWGDIMIGKYDSIKKRWIIRRPYRLIVDKCILDNTNWMQHK